MAAIPAFFLLSRYLTTNFGYREYFATVEGGARNLDKGTGENSDALPSEGDSTDIHVNEACVLECL